MNDRIISVISGTAGFLIGLLIIGFWFLDNPVEDIVYSIPGMDGRPASLEVSTTGVRIGSFHQRFTQNNQEAASDDSNGLHSRWPRFRGEEFSNISSDNPVSHWSSYEPVIAWRISLGEGHAAPAIWGNRVYLFDYDEVNQRDLLRCFSLVDGTELWQTGYGIPIKRNHGISRSIPAVTDKYVVTIGPVCQVMCVDAVTGEFKWGIDLEKEYGTKVPLWYTAQCPLIDEGTAIIAPAGDQVLMMGVDCESGEVLWECPNPDNWKISHSSIIPMTFGGKRMYVYAAVGGVVAVSAEAGEEGSVLWKTNAWNTSVVAPSPVIFEDGRIFLTSGYGAGSILIRIIFEEGLYSVEVVYRHSPKEGLACEQQTPLLYRERLFGILPKDAGPDRNRFVCYDPEGEILWRSEEQFGLGPFMIIGDYFYILNDNGELTIAEVSTDTFKPVARYKVLEGFDAWGPMAYSNGKLLLRDSGEMVCLVLKEQVSK